MKNGTYVIGTFVGYECKAWATNKDRFNHRIGVQTGEYDRGFGQMEASIESVDVFDEQAIQWILDNEKSLKGKQVMVPVVCRAKDGRNGAWLSQFMPKGEKPVLVGSPKEQAA